MAGMNPDVPPGLAEYLVKSSEARYQRILDNLNRFTPREQQLIREAAVMGFVRGSLGGKYDDKNFPSDSTIVVDMLMAIESQRDLYPLIGDHTCDCCGRHVRTPFHHDTHDDSGDSWDYCADCNDAGCDLVSCSL